jgi:hypothetical protein
VELVDEDVVDVETGLGAGEVALKAVVGRDVFRIQVLGAEVGVGAGGILAFP